MKYEVNNALYEGLEMNNLVTKILDEGPEKKSWILHGEDEVKCPHCEVIWKKSVVSRTNIVICPNCGNEMKPL